MPIVRLFVEGKLDIEVLSPVLQGSPALQQGGSKNALKPRAAAERRGNGVAAGYLRDRDFDFDPPPDLTKPAVDSEDAGVPFGWRWCRHEIENYLIDPAVVCEATAWAMPEVLEAIHRAAKRIRSYQAARWTVGVVRRALPPAYELQTRPGGLREIDLPPSLDAGSVNAWASNSVENHGVRIAAATAPPAVQASLAAYSARFDDAFVADAASVVLWFSGKDLLAGMADWPAGKGVPNPGALRAILRDWIIANPDRALELLPEWKNMLAVVRA